MIRIDLHWTAAILFHEKQICTIYSVLIQPYEYYLDPLNVLDNHIPPSLLCLGRRSLCETHKIRRLFVR